MKERTNRLPPVDSPKNSPRYTDKQQSQYIRLSQAENDSPDWNEDEHKWFVEMGAQKAGFKESESLSAHEVSNLSYLDNHTTNPLPISSLTEWELIGWGQNTEGDEAFDMVKFRAQDLCGNKYLFEVQKNKTGVFAPSRGGHLSKVESCALEHMISAALANNTLKYAILEDNIKEMVDTAIEWIRCIRA